MKQYCIFEKTDNGEFARVSAYSTRQEAARVLSWIFSNNVDADPQNFKIQEEEVEGQTKFDELIERLMQRLMHLPTKFVVDKKSETYQGDECVKLLINDNIDVWSGTALRAIIEVLGDNARFGLSKSPVSGKVEMLIVDNSLN